MVGSRSFARISWLAFFLLPGLLGLLAFTILPLIASLVLTLFQWDLLTPPQFVGFDNFVKLSQDKNFWSALRHTLAFIAGYLPLVLVLALGMALALNAPLRGIAFIRTAFFLPVVSSWVSVALLWSWLGWYYAESGNYARAAELRDWVAAQATADNALPKQVGHDLLAPDYYQG